MLLYLLVGHKNIREVFLSIVEVLDYLCHKHESSRILASVPFSSVAMEIVEISTTQRKANRFYIMYLIPFFFLYYCLINCYLSFCFHGAKIRIIFEITTRMFQCQQMNTIIPSLKC